LLTYCDTGLKFLCFWWFLTIIFTNCPGFRWDRVNFHQKPGGDTVGPADPNWSKKQGIQYHVPSCTWVPGGGAGPGGKWITAWERMGHKVVRVVPCIFAV